VLNFTLKSHRNIIMYKDHYHGPGHSQLAKRKKPANWTHHVGIRKTE